MHCMLCHVGCLLHLLCLSSDKLPATMPPPPHLPPLANLQAPEDDGGSPIQYYQVQVRARTPAARNSHADEWLVMYQVCLGAPGEAGRRASRGVGLGKAVC